MEKRERGIAVNDMDPRVKRTRKLLQDAMMGLLREKSFQSVTVQDIAERAMLNRATFYAHFEDKYALADYMLRGMFREAVDVRLAPRAPFTVENLRVLVVTVLELLAHFSGQCDHTHQDLQPIIEAKVQDELRTYLLAWLRQALPADGARPLPRETVASVMSWAIFGTGIEWSRARGARSTEEQADQLLEVLVGGVARAVKIPSGAAPARTQAAAHVR
ncbi:MAG TPA: TetR/AcrR family transcriptional regulator [Ktedonobacterales bacterium]